LFEQQQNQLAYPLSTPDKNQQGSVWKLCPARLRMESHELWIDNDVVISERMSSINRWLTGGYSIISEGLHRNYGIFSNMIPQPIKACAGLFGLPPNLNFESKTLEYCKEKINGNSLGYFDEQGLVTAIIVSDTYEIISSQQITICEPNESLPNLMPPAIHFVGANRTENHTGWKVYKKKFAKML